MEDKKEQLRKWFSEEELSVLSELVNEKEIVKNGNVFTDLYSQMSYAMSDIAEFKNNIVSEVKSVASETGFSRVAEILLDSIPLFISDELGIKDCLLEMESEQNIDAERLMTLYNDIFSRINTAKHFFKINYLQNEIALKEKVAKMAINKILI